MPGGTRLCTLRASSSRVIVAYPNTHDSLSQLYQYPIESIVETEGVQRCPRTVNCCRYSEYLLPIETGTREGGAVSRIKNWAPVSVLGFRGRGRPGENSTIPSIGSANRLTVAPEGRAAFGEEILTPAQGHSSIVGERRLFVRSKHAR